MARKSIFLIALFVLSMLFAGCGPGPSRRCLRWHRIRILHRKPPSSVEVRLDRERDLTWDLGPRVYRMVRPGQVYYWPSWEYKDIP